jgi:hypothetical protein
MPPASPAQQRAIEAALRGLEHRSRGAGSLSEKVLDSFLAAVGKLYGVADSGRHYILIPCSGVTIGVDNLRRDSVRRVHAFTDGARRLQELSPVAEEVRDFANQFDNVDIGFVDRLGAKNQERRYVGWEWKVSLALHEEVEIACKLIERLRAAIEQA